MLVVVRAVGNVSKHVLEPEGSHRRVACASRGFVLVPLVVVQGMVHEAGRDILALGLGEIGLFNGSAK